MQIEQIIKEKIDYISHVMYYIMEVKQENFGFSWNQINEGFCRSILNVPFDKRISDKEVLKFQNLILEKRKAYDLIGVDPEALENLISGEYFEFAEEKIPVYAQDKINTLLKKSGSKNKLITGLYGGKEGYIFGEVGFQNMGANKVCIIKKEEARTPNRVLELAAVVIGKVIYLRRESFQNLFVNNWLSIFEAPQLKINKILAREDVNIQYHLRKKALKLWGIDTKEKLLDEKDRFISEVMRLTLQHEIGHREVQQTLSLDEFAIGCALGNLGNNVASALGELLADWSKAGPLKYILEKRSLALLYMYLTDKWFFSDKNKSLNLQTEIFVSFLIKHLKSRLEFDFDTFTQEFDNTHRLLLQEFKEIIEKTKELLESTIFQVSGNKLGFKTMASALKTKFKETDGYLSEGTPAFKNAFWHQIICRAPHQEIKEYLKKKEIYLKVKIVDSKNVLNQFKKLGFYQAPAPLSTEEIYTIICYEAGLYKDEAEKVFVEYFKIIAHGGMDLRGAYHYLNIEPNLFFSLLRFILQKLERIQPITGLSFGLPIEDKTKIKDKEQELRKRLDKLIEFIKKEKISHLPLFRIEKDYLSEERLKQIFSEYALGIVQIQFVELSHNFIFEVFIQPRPDFLDSILLHAISQINQKIRPQEIDKTFVLDKTVLEYLAREYLKV